ncbi:hypothetical protein UFOVP1290_492 [uncultured Caudovirales phage]|uniref:Uncharacterized protein n=1 Tax=uncultured Caudovirales phage TaxID=2100421 RepID=A0A6J5RLN8_9CAUD|nr:hypothetical protein UFOVP1290_492 [uncultured Caudovirales phage]
MGYKDLINENGSLTELGIKKLEKIKYLIIDIMQNVESGTKLTLQQRFTFGSCVLKVVGDTLSDIRMMKY